MQVVDIIEEYISDSFLSSTFILSQFHLGEDYLLGNEGFLCSDKYFPFVDNIDDCHKSFLAIKLRYPDAKNSVQPEDLGFESRPQGCFFHLPKKTLYWNPLKPWNKNDKGNQEDRQVCKAKGKIKTLQLNYSCLKNQK